MRILALSLFFFLGIPNVCHAAWRKTVSPSFIIYGDMNEASLLAFTRKVERFDTLRGFLWHG